MTVDVMRATTPATWTPLPYNPAEADADIATEIKLPPPKYEIAVVDSEVPQIKEKETYTQDDPIEDINLLYETECAHNTIPNAPNGDSLVLSPRDGKDLVNVVGYFNNRLTNQVKSFIKPDAIYDFLKKIFIGSRQTDTFKNLTNIHERISNDWLKNMFMPNVVQQVRNFIGESSVHIHDGLIAIEKFDAYKDPKSIPEDIRIALREKMLTVKGELEGLSLPIVEEIQDNPLPDFKFIENNFSQVLGSLAIIAGASLLAAPVWVPITLLLSACVIKTAAPLLRQRAGLVIEDKKEVKEKCIDPVISKLARRIKMLTTASNGSTPPSPTLSAANTAALNADVAAKRAAAAEAEAIRTREELAEFRKAAEEAAANQKQFQAQILAHLGINAAIINKG